MRKDKRKIKRKKGRSAEIQKQEKITFQNYINVES